MLRFLTAGESHGPAVLAILEGMPAGLQLSPDDIAPDLARRQQGYGAGPRMKLERDQVEILSGVMAGETLGSPIAMRIENRVHDRWKGTPVDPMTVPRPGHADLTGAVKYGYRDLRRSLERASARETAARVAVGSVCRRLLGQFHIQVGSYVCEIGSARASFEGMGYAARFQRAEASAVRCPSEAGDAAIQAEIEAAIKAKDTLGGVFEVIALGVPAGLGSYVHWDRRLDAQLAYSFMSIPGIKGVEIGEGFANARKRGTQVHDEIHLSGGELVRPTNNAGGTEGGISNGQPLVARAAMKPISTTLTPRQSVDLQTGEAAETRYERSDFCAVPRATVIGEALMCYVLAGELLAKLGGDSMQEMVERYKRLRETRLVDLEMDGTPAVFWE
jgi:chorismate synthase